MNEGRYVRSQRARLCLTSNKLIGSASRNTQIDKELRVHLSNPLLPSAFHSTSPLYHHFSRSTRTWTRCRPCSHSSGQISTPLTQAVEVCAPRTNRCRYPPRTHSYNKNSCLDARGSCPLYPIPKKYCSRCVSMARFRRPACPTYPECLGG